jgi:hypothetical protein
MEKLTIIVPVKKPRARQLNSVLLAAKCGRMRNARDFNRADLQRALRKQLNDV